MQASLGVTFSPGVSALTEQAAPFLPVGCPSSSVYKPYAGNDIGELLKPNQFTVAFLCSRRELKHQAIPPSTQ